MTLDEAVQLAADWWLAQIANGHWDNGDIETESTHFMFASLAPGPTKDELPILRKAIVDAILSTKMDLWDGGTRYNLYADYGCAPIDAATKSLGVKFSSYLHAPQKAGTDIRVTKDGRATVKAKSGYGMVYEVLTKSAEAAKEKP